jgi:hypothetical protein
MRWWPWGGKRREPAVAAAHPTPPVIGSAEPDGAWRDLPAMQCTLVDPLRPVAINKDFRDSLASYADPSFVAPLAHQVDPEAGGLVEGLISPGVPYANASGPELAVPRSLEPAAARTFGRSKNPGQIHTQPVQRRAISSSSADLSGSADIPTVALELPGSPTPDSPLPYADSEASTPTDPGVLAPTEAVLPPEAATRTGAVPLETTTPTEAPTLTSAAMPPETTSTRIEAVPPETTTPTEAPTLTSAAMPSAAPAEDPSSRPSFFPDAPLIEGAEARRWGVTEPSAGETASDIAAPSRELPVVARSVDRSNAELPLPLRNRAPAVPSGRDAPPVTSNVDLPVLSRMAESAAGSAPLSGFAEAITQLNGTAEAPAHSGETLSSDDQAVGGDDEAASSDDHMASAADHVAADDHSAPSVLPAVRPPIQRDAAKRQSSDGREAESSVVVRSAPSPMVPDRSLPVVSRRTDAGSNPVEASAEQPIESRSDTPTLGARLVQAPPILQRASLTERVSAPAEPAVQRVEFLAPRLAPDRRSSGSSSAQSRDQGPAPTSTPTPVAPVPAATELTAHRLPSQDEKRASNFPRKHLLPVSRRETQLEETQVSPAHVEDVVAGASVQRLESLDPATSGPAVTPNFSVSSEMQAKLLTREVNPVTVDLPSGSAAAHSPTAAAVAELPTGRTIADLPTPPAVAERPTGRAVADVPTVATATEVPRGPAVIAEPWTSAAQTSASGPGVPAGHSSLPTVSRIAAHTPTYPTSRSAGANPRIAIGPSIPVQRIAAVPSPSADPRSSPLIVSRRVAADAASRESRPGGAVSFASLFVSEGSESGSAAEDGFTSVQLQSADESASPASEPAADTSSPPVSSAPPPPASGGTPTADLDELARRLYEPLTARLRAELWLDRERTGVMSDV